MGDMAGMGNELEKLWSKANEEKNCITREEGEGRCHVFLNDEIKCVCGTRDRGKERMK